MNREEIIRMARPKEIPSCPGYYVDEQGEVYNYRGTRLAQQVTDKGYCRVHLSINGEPKSKSVHSLVAETFIGPRPVGYQIRHKDGVKTNNTIGNLVYGTPSENEADKAAHGTKSIGDKNGMRTKPESRPRGSKHGKTRLDEANVLYIREQLSSGIRGTAAKLARQFEVSPQTISDIKSGRVWGHL